MKQQEQVTILTVADQGPENLRLSMKALEFCDWDNKRVLIIDNASSDGTRDFLEREGSWPYVVMEERLGYSELINAAIDAFEIQGHILLLSSDYIMAPGCLKGMMRALQKDRVGAVNCVYNGSEEFLAAAGRGRYSYQQATELFHNRCMGWRDKRRVTLKDGCILFRKELWQEGLRLDEQFCCKEVSLMDYMLELASRGYHFLTAGDAFAYCKEGDSKESLYHAVFERETDQNRLRQKRGIYYLNNEYNGGLLDFIQEAPESSFSVLEIGCNCGENLAEICNRYPKAELYGFEINSFAAQIAGKLGKISTGDVERDELPYSAGMFDYIVTGDVLEHLKDPDGCVRKLRYYLKEDGRLLISVPNLQHISVTEELLEGRFTYKDSGLLDRDHIHFFTLKEITELLKSEAYEIEDMEWITQYVNEKQRQLTDKLLDLGNGLERYMLEAYQYHICARKLPEPDRGSVLILRGMSPILDYVAGQFCSAYRRNGYRVYEMDCWTLGEKGYQLFHLIREGLDRVIVFNNTGWQVYWNGENMWDYFHIPCVNYVLDHPFYYFDTLDKAPCRGILACVDQSHVRYAQRFYDRVKKSIFLPLAGEDLTGGNYKKLGERSISVLSCVGSKAQVDYPFDDFALEIIQVMKKNTGLKLDNVICEALGSTSEGKIENQKVKSVVEKYRWIDRYLKQWGRELAIRILVEAGIDVYVCGVGWDQAEIYSNPYFHWLGNREQKECLKLMQDSKIILNVMPWFREGLHDRVINAMLSGAVCISEDNGYLSDCFERDKDYLAFSLEYMERLPELTRSVLDNPEAYQNNVDMAYRKAADKHTWDSRIRQLEEKLSVVLEKEQKDWA